MMLDLIEQVTAVRGQVRAIEVEWEAVRAQIQKGWQRMEKANDRAEKRNTMMDEGEPEPVVVPDPGPKLHGFAEKLREMKGA